MDNKFEISEALEKARLYVDGTKAKKQRPFFHVSAPVGWINDPNGFSTFKGEAHLFYQYHPYSTNWGPMHWGHVKTKDFIKWEELPVALAPDTEYDGFGCFSGSAVEHNGRHVLVYTGVEQREEENGKTVTYQTQCVAFGDGINYKKSKLNPVIDASKLPEGGSKFDFRDPKVWLDGDMAYLAVGNRAADDSGQILIYKSLDFENWEFVSTLIQNQNRYGKMWECPDFFSLDGKHVLITSPQEMKAKKDLFHCGDSTIVVIGDFDKEKFTLKQESVLPVDMGLDFYAPQTLLTDDGRRIMIGWLAAWCKPWFTEEDGFAGMMTIPRELSIKDGKLYQYPVKELENYYGDRKTVKHNLSLSLTKLEQLSGRVQNIDFEISGKDDLSFEIRLAAMDDLYTELSYSLATKELLVDRSCAGMSQDCANIRRVKIEPKNGKIRIRAVMDIYSIELFINDGEKAVSLVIRTPLEYDGVYVRGSKDCVLEAVKNEIIL